MVLGLSGHRSGKGYFQGRQSWWSMRTEAGIDNDRCYRSCVADSLGQLIARDCSGFIRGSRALCSCGFTLRSGKSSFLVPPQEATPTSQWPWLSLEPPYDFADSLYFSKLPLIPCKLPLGHIVLFSSGSGPLCLFFTYFL